MKKLVLFTISFILCAYTHAQCPPGDVMLLNQSQVDNFALQYPNCSNLNSNLTIEGADITDLSPLSTITTVEESMRIKNNPMLTNLSGLDNLTSVNVLIIERNDSLTSLSGLEALTSVDFRCSIQDNDALTNLSGLDALNFIDDLLIIQRNDELINLTGLESLTSIAGELIIRQNTALTSLIGLENLSSLDDLTISENGALTIISSLSNLNTLGELNIDNNDALTSLSGLDNIATLGDLFITYNNTLTDISALNNVTIINRDADFIENALLEFLGLNSLSFVTQLRVMSNDNLINFTGLENLSTIDGDFSIIDNPMMTSLDGLEALNEIGEKLEIINNPLLSMCSQPGICAHLEANNSNTIQFNAVGCNFVSQIEGLCTPLPECPPNGANLCGQQQVEYFILQYPNCTELNGGLYIGGSNCNFGIFDLTPLSQLTVISGNVQIEGISADLSGLNNLTSIGGKLQINDNWSINDLNVLSNLHHIGGELSIYQNSGFNSLAGLENIDSIGGLLISRNFGLDNLEGLNNLQYIGGNFICWQNGINSLSALSNLTSVNGFMNIDESITSLEALENIDYTGITRINISGNYNLTDCTVNSICNYLENNWGPYDIQNNAEGCNSAEEILENCITLPIEMTTPLRVYLDGKTAILRWRTDTETNNSGFEIQRSKDGITWQRIGWQAGQGTTTTSPHSYTHRDLDPLSGTSYYRLKQVDFDGDFEYSNAVSLRYTPATVEISPNPSEGIFQVNGIPKGTYQIHDTTGRIIQSGDMKNDLSIDISQEAQGVYFMSIQIENETITKRIIKM